MAFLQVESGELSGRRFEIGEEPVTIGRTEDNQIVLGDVAVSSHHCQVLQAGALCKVQDLDSTNGTLLNSAPVKESFLQDGDVIMVGAVGITYRSEGLKSDELTADDESSVEETSLPTQASGETATFLFKPRRRKNRGLLSVVFLVAICVAAAAFFLHRLFSY